MEKVDDSHSSSELVTPTRNEMTKQRQRALKVEAESSEICFEKIKGALEKLRETGDTKTSYKVTDGTVMIWGYLDPEKLKMELENEAGDAIRSITDPAKSIHSGRDGTVIELENEDVLGQPQGLSEMPVTEVADSSNEILSHSENTMESSKSSLRFPRVMAVDVDFEVPEMERSRPIPIPGINIWLIWSINIWFICNHCFVELSANKLPEMPIPEDCSCTKITYYGPTHLEKGDFLDSQKRSRRRWCGAMSEDYEREMRDAKGSGFHEMPADEMEDVGGSWFRRTLGAISKFSKMLDSKFQKRLAAEMMMPTAEMRDAGAAEVAKSFMMSPGDNSPVEVKVEYQKLKDWIWTLDMLIFKAAEMVEMESRNYHNAEMTKMEVEYQKLKSWIRILDMLIFEAADRHTEILSADEMGNTGGPRFPKMPATEMVVLGGSVFSNSELLEFLKSVDDDHAGAQRAQNIKPDDGSRLLYTSAIPSERMNFEAMNELPQVKTITITINLADFFWSFDAAFKFKES